MNLTYYEELGVQPDATDEQIRHAYRNVAKKLHPDVNPGMGAWADAQMKRLNVILETLTNPSKRRQYDDALKARKPYEPKAEPEPVAPRSPAQKHTWMDIMTAAEAARRLMLANRERGTAQFDALLRIYPNEPMVVYKRGEALADLGERELAKRDFTIAAARFPIEKWRRIARAAAQKLS